MKEFPSDLPFQGGVNVLKKETGIGHEQTRRRSVYCVWSRPNSPDLYVGAAPKSPGSHNQWRQRSRPAGTSQGVLTQPLEEHTARTQRSASGLKTVDVSSFSTHLRATMWSGFLKYYHDLLELCGPMQNGIVMKCDFLL